MLPPQLGGIAYAGLHASVQHVLTVALEARWLKDVLKGEIQLPSEEAQLEDVAAQEVRRRLGTQEDEAERTRLARWGSGGGSGVANALSVTLHPTTD